VPGQAVATTRAAAADTTTSDTSTNDGGSLVSDGGTGGSSAPGKITVPNEIGKNHQAAQDDTQAHGLYNLSEEDATGQGRMLILDRNGKVVSQSPTLVCARGIDDEARAAGSLPAGQALRSPGFWLLSAAMRHGRRKRLRPFEAGAVSGRARAGMRARRPAGSAGCPACA
jgi:hypothetical protein